MQSQHSRVATTNVLEAEKKLRCQYLVNKRASCETE